MAVQDPSFSRSYRPWGQVRRKNMIARVLYAMLMTVAGLGILAGLVLLAIFASAALVVAVAAFAVMGAVATLRRKPARVFVRTDDKIMEARKSGTTWTVY